MKKISVIVLVLTSIFIYTSCQQIFTYSALEWAQRDPSNLPPAQQIAYAEAALASGDQAAVEAAYAALSSSSDPDVQVLASQLAVSASGLEGAITEAIATLTFDTSTIAAIDGTWLANAETAMYAADTGNADITPEEYLAVATALIVMEAQSLVAPDTPNDINDVDIAGATANQGGSNVDKALYYAVAAGYTQSDFDAMFTL